MSVIQLPPSLNLTEQKRTLASGVEGFMHRYPATRSEYAPGDEVVIELSTGGRNAFLFGNESYLSFEFTPTFTAGTSGKVYLDGTAFAFIQRFSLYHGSNELCSLANAGKCWQALYDLQVPLSDGSATIDMGVGETPYDGMELTSGHKYVYCIPLIAPLVGSLSDLATPLGWAQASGALRIVIQLAQMRNCVTSSSAASADNLTETATTANTLSTYLIENPQFHAKIARLSPDLNSMLLESMQGRPISIPAVDYRSESTFIAADQVGVGARLNFNFSSLKAIMWWTQCQAIANGAPSGNTNPRSHSSRFAGGALKKYYLSVDGRDTLHIETDNKGKTLGSTSTRAQRFISSIPFCEVKRIFNGITTASQAVRFHRDAYATSTPIEADQRDIPGRFVAGLDLERSDSSAMAFSGIDCKNSNVVLNIEYNPKLSGDGTSSAHVLYVYGMADVLYTLVNGSFVRSD